MTDKEKPDADASPFHTNTSPVRNPGPGQPDDKTVRVHPPQGATPATPATPANPKTGTPATPATPATHDKTK